MTRHLFLLIVLMSSVCARGQVPGWAKDLTKAPVGPYLNVPPCELTFELGWNNFIMAGKASLSVKEAGNYWRADATASSTGFARTLWKYDCEMTSIIERGTIHPRFLSHSETDSAENCRYRVSFEPNRAVTETTITPQRRPRRSGFQTIRCACPSRCTQRYSSATCQHE
ncbi:MAG: DUF3108 domain-containing protein [Verrucomicrobia bacterium]|nr:DUF3108 domain-containing protein [Verrucomicrobiota bacterium]